MDFPSAVWCNGACLRIPGHDAMWAYKLRICYIHNPRSPSTARIGLMLNKHKTWSIAYEEKL